MGAESQGTLSGHRGWARQGGCWVVEASQDRSSGKRGQEGGRCGHQAGLRGGRPPASSSPSGGPVGAPKALGRLGPWCVPSSALCRLQATLSQNSAGRQGPLPARRPPQLHGALRPLRSSALVQSGAGCPARSRILPACHPPAESVNLSCSRVPRPAARKSPLHLGPPPGAEGPPARRALQLAPAAGRPALPGLGLEGGARCPCPRAPASLRSWRWWGPFPPHLHSVPLCAPPASVLSPWEALPPSQTPVLLPGGVGPRTHTVLQPLCPYQGLSRWHWG